MRVVRRIGVISLANVYALISVVFGIIIGLITGVMSCAVSAIDTIGLLGFGLGAIGIVVLPILYGIIGWICGAIGALVYNLVAGWIGGIKIELD